ncbi:MAG: rod-binding protein [Treponema sp.]|jgi:flagellar protein FlgJ|nr:rod-binding protein [Treponema sp.]
MSDSIGGISAYGAGYLDTAYVPFAERSKPNFLETLEQARQKAAANAEPDTRREGSPAAGTAAPAAAEKRIPGAPGFSKTLPDFNEKLYEQCEALEGFLIKNLLSGMRKTIIKSKLLDTGFAGQMYEDMLWEEYAKDYTKNTDFGLAEMAYMELTNRRGTGFPS